MATPPSPPDPNAAIKAEADKLKAQAELERARADLVKAYGIPSFEGKTTLNANAGAIEALILATDAILEAAQQIASEVAETRHPIGGTRFRHFLLLAGDEQIEFSLVSTIRSEIAAFEAIFDAVPLPGAGVLAQAALAAPIAAISAIAGLLRTESTVTAVDLASISHRVLATAVAGELRERVILLSAVTGIVAVDSPLVSDLMILARRRDEVAAALPHLPQDERDRLQAALTRFDSFFARVTSTDSSGRIPLIHAARLEQISIRRPLVLRVYVEKAGGSLVQRTNIWTHFGADPVRVSGGLVASYTVTEPETGIVLAAKVLNSRTAVATFEKIQSGAELRNSSRTKFPVADSMSRSSIDSENSGQQMGSLLLAFDLTSVRTTATLKVKAKKSDDRYTIVIDGYPVQMGSDKIGYATVEGSCGDGSNHHVNYSWYGSAGEKLSFSITCNGNPVFSIRDAEVPASTAPNAADQGEFQL